MCLYDVTNGIPLLLDCKGKEKKNKEIECLCEYLQKEKIDKDVILVADRAYTKFPERII